MRQPIFLGHAWVVDSTHKTSKKLCFRKSSIAGAYISSTPSPTTRTQHRTLANQHGATPCEPHGPSRDQRETPTPRHAASRHATSPRGIKVDSPRTSICKGQREEFHLGTHFLLICRPFTCVIALPRSPSQKHIGRIRNDIGLQPRTEGEKLNTCLL